MASFSRTQEFSACQFEPHPAEHDAEVFFQRAYLGRSLPDLSLYDVEVSRHPVADANEGTESRLTVVQRHLDAFGERSNIVHVLRPTEWLVEDHTAEGGYRVMADAEFAAIAGLKPTS